MDNKIVYAGLGRAPTKLPPMAGKTKTKTTKRVKSSRPNKGKKSLAAKQSDQQQLQSDQQQQQSDQQQQQSEQQQQQSEQQHQPIYDSDMSDDEKAEQQALIELKKRVQSERPYAEQKITLI